MSEPGSMVEKVGAALEQFVKHYPPSVRKIRREEAARAAIAAMEEPTEGMRSAVGKGPGQGIFHETSNPLEAWRAMIQAALNPIGG